MPSAITRISAKHVSSPARKKPRVLQHAGKDSSLLLCTDNGRGFVKVVLRFKRCIGSLRFDLHRALLSSTSTRSKTFSCTDASSIHRWIHYTLGRTFIVKIVDRLHSQIVDFSFCRTMHDGFHWILVKHEKEDFAQAIPKVRRGPDNLSLLDRWFKRCVKVVSPVDLILGTSHPRLRILTDIYKDHSFRLTCSAISPFNSGSSSSEKSKSSHPNLRLVF